MSSEFSLHCQSYCKDCTTALGIRSNPLRQKLTIKQLHQLMSPWRNHVIHSKEATVDRRDQLSRKTREVSETGQSRSNKRHRPHHQTRKFPFYILWVTSRTLCHSDPSHVWQQYGEVIICSVYNWDEGGDSWKAIVLTEGGTEGGRERASHLSSVGEFCERHWEASRSTEGSVCLKRGNPEATSMLGGRLRD